MKIIDGEVYVNKDDAMKAMLKEIKYYEEKDASSEIVLCIGMTMTSFISGLFRTEGSEQDEHQ